MNTIIYSIDLGTSQPRLLVAEVDDSQTFGFKVLHSEEKKTSRGVKRGQIVAVDEASRVINDLIMGANKKLGKKYESKDRYKKVYCININGFQFYTEYKDSQIDVSSKTRIDENDIKRLTDQIRAEVGVRAEQITISVDPTDYSVDGMPKTNNVIGVNGQRLTGTCFVVMATKNSIAPYNNLIPMVKFDQFCTTASAKAKVLIPPTAKNRTIALVDIGYGTINIAIVKNGNTRFESMIPIGADLITSDIENELEVSHKEAEALKQEIQSLLSLSTTDVDITFSEDRVVTINTKLLKLIISARVEELVAYIESILSKSGMTNSIDLIALTGGGANTYGMLDCVKKRFEGKTVNILNQTSYDNIDNEHLIKYSACYGMTIQYVRNNPVIEPEISFADNEQIPFVEPDTNNNNTTKQTEPQKEEKAKRKGFDLSNFLGKLQDKVLGAEEPSIDGDLK